MDPGGGGKLLQSSIQLSIAHLRCLNEATAIHLHVTIMLNQLLTELFIRADMPIIIPSV